ncbi:hypothetical protein LF41_728 [Lysobacter dokdonensis DS-58]|uniref:Uncharacterized protein n=1 Tax=Lysobacter dokdonensis DS-58 TaxID=1300345 RepID=A0A0A2WFA3_9GAMM|nr:hypothetical protein LF41_728 [Lysobacter dokdonensis DS-58]
MPRDGQGHRPLTPRGWPRPADGVTIQAELATPLLRGRAFLRRSAAAGPPFPVADPAPTP